MTISPFKKNLIALSMFFSLGVCLSSAEAAVLNRVVFPSRLETKENTLELKGLGLKKYFMFKVFVAGFYLGEDVPASRALANVPKRIEVAYFINVPGKKLAQETRRMIIDNVTPKMWTQIKERVDRMDRYFVDLKAGDRYVLNYTPEIGTQFLYNGQLQGTIEGADFAMGLFAVWVGDKPVDKLLKAKLLGLN